MDVFGENCTAVQKRAKVQIWSCEVISRYMINRSHHSYSLTPISRNMQIVLVRNWEVMLTVCTSSVRILNVCYDKYIRYSPTRHISFSSAANEANTNRLRGKSVHTIWNLVSRLLSDPCSGIILKSTDTSGFAIRGSDSGSAYHEIFQIN
jgi:hypothetical protein